MVWYGSAYVSVLKNLEKLVGETPRSTLNMLGWIGLGGAVPYCAVFCCVMLWYVP